ncbi:MAG: hypothetical protein IPJ23_13190 [Ignavibacteriales bacterium]|nr:hypothetical protein [Ignavibacteriales bacterium]
MPSFVPAQVIIKEKVEINPQGIILPDAPLSNHTIRVDIQWSPASLPGWIMYYDLDCDQNSYSSASSTTGSNTFSLTSPGYENYQIQFRFGSLNPNQPTITGTYQLYYDEQLIRSASFQAQKATYSSYAYFNTHYQSPVLTDYNFSIYASEICPGSYEDIYITTSRNCNATAEINTEQDSITLTIETGREFVSFYKNSQKKDTVTFMFNELGSIHLRQDITYIGSTPLDINIKSDWTGLIKYQQLVVNPQEQFQIRVPDQPRIVYSGGVGALIIEPYSTSICPPYVSENLRYTALIKKGSNRGLLYDYDSGNSGDTLTNLTLQEDGEKYLDFITEGEILSQTDTVIVKVFTNDENIDTIEATIIIYPNEIEVQIIPSVVSPGDTARVVLKKRGVNGLEDFAADKVFNVEIVQGLEFGLILDSLSNDTLTTFSNIPQGFKIITRDSTGTDSAKIRIKVSTEESGFPVASMIRNNTKTNKNEVVDDNENKKNDDEIITPDWIIPGPILLEGFGDVVVKKDGDWCDSLIICNSSEYLPNILLNQVPNGYYGRDVCTPNIGQLEGVNAFWTDTLYSFDLSLCNNDQRQKLWFNINDNHTLKVNYSLTICEDHAPGGCQFIDDWTGLADTLTCDEIEDILSATAGYGTHATPCYYFKNIIYAHEQEHISDYQRSLDNKKTEFYNGLEYIGAVCAEFETKESAKAFWQNTLERNFLDFKNDCFEDFKDLVKNIGGWDKYELDVQNRGTVKDVINSQIEAVNNSLGCSMGLLNY